MKRLLALASVASAAACGGDVVTTGARGGEAAGGASHANAAGGNAAVGNAHGGHATAGAAGTAGTLAGGGEGMNAQAGGPQASGFFRKRPGRPRSLSHAQGSLYWILGSDEQTATGPVEATVATQDGEVRAVFPAEVPIDCFAVPPDDAHVWAVPAAPVGGIVRRDLTGADPVGFQNDGVSATELVVVPGYAYRVATGDRADSWLERVGLVDGSVERVGESENADAYVGGLADDGAALYFSQEGYGSGSGIFRVPRGKVDATYLGGNGAHRFSLAGEALVRVEVFGSTEPKPRVIDLLLKSGGDLKVLGASPAATSAAAGVALGGFYYLAFRPSETAPWGLARLPLAGGESAVVSANLCGPNRWHPSLAASATTLFVACPGDGTVRSVDGL